MKTVMLGIDAADLDFIEARLATLPGFRRALETGVLRRLRGHSALLSGSVWPTFYTGTPPGEHGIYHHLQWDRQRMRLRRVSADWLYCEPFWYGLSRRGCNVVVVDVPMSFPPRLGSVTEIVSWGSHDQLGPFSTNPQNLGGEILRRFGQHPMGCEIPVDKSDRELAQIRQNLVEGASRKGALCRWLLGARPWQLFIAIFGECHRGGHILWPATSRRDLAPPDDALVSVYQAVDREIEAILASLDLNETRVIIFSLHGMGPNTSQEHFLPEVLVRASRHFGGLNPDAGGERARSSRGFSLARYLRANVPPGVQNAIARSVPVPVRDLVVNRSTTGGYDWNTTPAFALLADLHGYLRFNVKGREARGTSSPATECSSSTPCTSVTCYWVSVTPNQDKDSSPISIWLLRDFPVTVRATCLMRSSPGPTRDPPAASNRRSSGRSKQRSLPGGLGTTGRTVSASRSNLDRAAARKAHPVISRSSLPWRVPGSSRPRRLALRSRSSLVFPVILAIGIIVRLLFWAGYQGRDDSYYIIHAAAFADHGEPGIEYTQRWIGRSGLWLPMSLCIKLFGAREFAFGLYPFLASLAGLLLAYRMGIALFDRRTGALAMLLLAFFPLDVMYASHAYPDGPFGLWAVLSLYFFLVAQGRESRWWYGAAGLSAGLAYLHKETAVFLIIPFAVLVIWKRRLRAEYLFIALGVLLVVLLESGFWSSVADDPFYRAKCLGIGTESGQQAALASGPGVEGRPRLRKIGRGRSPAFEPILMFLTNQEFGLLYYFIFPLVAYLTIRRDKTTAPLCLWIVTLALAMAYAPVVRGVPLDRAPRYFTCLSIPAVIVLASWLVTISRGWCAVIVGVIASSSLFCLYVDASRVATGNERILGARVERESARSFWVDPNLYRKLLILSGFKLSDNVGVHLLTVKESSHSFSLVKVARPDVAIAPADREIHNAYVVIQGTPDRNMHGAPYSRGGWQLDSEIQLRRSGSAGVIVAAIDGTQLLPGYVDRLKPSGGSKLSVWWIP